MILYKELNKYLDDIDLLKSIEEVLSYKHELENGNTNGRSSIFHSPVLMIWISRLSKVWMNMTKKPVCCT